MALAILKCDKTTKGSMNFKKAEGLMGRKLC
ncbi:unknown [Bacteroides sp. CAG:530]|nr:unknown [Bacteroides sp. CAG:530]